MRFVNPTKKNLKNIYTDSPPYSYKEFILYLVEITELLTKYKLFKNNYFWKFNKRIIIFN